MNVTVLVADDEPLARRKLAAMIHDVPWATQVGEAGDGASAVKSAVQLKPDIVFLDIQMPVLSGIEVVKRLGRMQSAPAVVFTTAHDRYAVTAFELEAVDYLLKPFGIKRFLSAIERARQCVAVRGTDAALDRAQFALSVQGASTPLDRLFVREGNAVLPIALSAVERFEAQDDYVMIYTEDRRHLVGLRIAELEARLPSPPFLRVHRSHIVNLDRVERMVALEDSRLEVWLRSGAKVTGSRARSQHVRKLAR